MENLGLEEKVTGFRLSGIPPNLLSVILEVIEAIEMTPDGQADIREYPNAAGKGGEGIQVYQPLTESWVMGGTWPRWGYTRIVLSSCKPYNAKYVAGLLAARIGPILMQGEFDL